MSSMRATVLIHAMSRDTASKDRHEQAMKTATPSRLRRRRVPSQGGGNRAGRPVGPGVGAVPHGPRRSARPASRAGNATAVESVRDAALTPAAESAMNALNELGDAESAAAKAAVADAHNRYESARSVTIVTLDGRPARRRGVRSDDREQPRPPGPAVAVVADGLAEGDLTRRAGLTSRDEIGVMAAPTGPGRHHPAVDDLPDRRQQRYPGRLGPGDDHGERPDRDQRGADQHAGRQVAAAAEEVSANVETVAAGTEEMGASIREIAPAPPRRPGSPRSAVRPGRVDQRDGRPSWASRRPRSATSSR